MVGITTLNVAVFYGHDSDFIKGKQLKRRRLLLVLLLISILAFAAFAILFKRLWVASPIAFLILWPSLSGMLKGTAKDTGSTFRFLLRSLGWADNGLLGERIIRKELEKLPESYSVFQGLRPNQKNDIDFTVVGPNGVFTVEVKSQTGRLEFNQHGRGQRLLRQARKEAMEMYYYLLEGWRIKTYVHGVLAFARSGTKIKVEMQPMDNVYVVKTENLISTILGQRGNNLQKEQIEKVLKFAVPKVNSR